MRLNKLFYLGILMVPIFISWAYPKQNDTLELVPERVWAADTSTLANSYDTLIAICGGRFITHNNEKWGVVDGAGNIVIPFECDGLRQISDSVLLVSFYKRSYPLPTGNYRYEYEGFYLYFTCEGLLKKPGRDFILVVEGEKSETTEFDKGPYYFLPDIVKDTVQTKPVYPNYNIRNGYK